MLDGRDEKNQSVFWLVFVNISLAFGICVK